MSFLPDMSHMVFLHIRLEVDPLQIYWGRHIQSLDALACTFLQVSTTNYHMSTHNYTFLTLIIYQTRWLLQGLLTGYMRLRLWIRSRMYRNPCINPPCPHIESQTCHDSMFVLTDCYQNTWRHLCKDTLKILWYKYLFVNICLKSLSRKTHFVQTYKPSLRELPL